MRIAIFLTKSKHMKKYVLQLSLIGLLTLGYSCKGKDKATDTTTTTTNTTSTPVQVSTDDALRTGVTDATKDFPGVNASVSDGVITLTGEIAKDSYPTLKQTLDALRPKQVINNLNYK